MRYAVIENGIVTNIIALLPQNASEFRGAVQIEDSPANIGDTYADGKFYRDGIALSEYEEAVATMQEVIDL